MMSKTYLLSLYVSSIYFLFNFSNILTLLILIEFNVIMFVCIMIYLSSWKYSQEMNDIFLFYFIVQGLSSSFFLANFFFSFDFFILYPDFFFILAMLVKLGIFPFFYWVFKIRDSIDLFSFCIFLTIQKIPFFFLLFGVFDHHMIYFLWGSFFSGSLMILSSKDFKHMIVCSSISYSFWTFYLFIYSSTLFFLFYVLYGIFTFLLFSCYFFNKGNLDWLFSSACFCFFFGLAPFSLFFVKLTIVGELFLGLGVLEFFLFWVFSFLPLFGYMKFFFKGLGSVSGVYSYINFWKNKMFVMSLSILLFLGFLL